MSMTLAQMRTEVLAHGFDPGVYSARVTQYLNDAQALACRRVEYYVDEAASDLSTVVGTSLYPLPANFAKVRSVRDTGRQQEMVAVGLRDIDRSIATSGSPEFYALDAANIHLYPTPDNIYPIEIRYWLEPADLVNDTDTTSIPAAYQRMLIYHAIGECYAADDDTATAQYWEGLFTNLMAEFAGDVKFPNDDMPTVAAGMWESGRALHPRGWQIMGTDWGW